MIRYNPIQIQSKSDTVSDAVMKNLKQNYNITPYPTLSVLGTTSRIKINYPSLFTDTSS